MILFPNAKINLGLHVVSRRPDGYHNLETVFYPIRLKDALEIVTPPETVDEEASNLDSRDKDIPPCGYRFFQTGIPINGPTDNNLAIKALKLIQSERKIPDMDIHLLKKIPFGAGLGGGSSDAAFMLRLLNETFDLGYTQDELLVRAAQLGADCPFFILNKPAFASGIGDKLEPVDLDLKKYKLLLVKPDIMVSTKEAYEMITPQKPKRSLKEVINEPPETWKELLKNDFEPPIFKKFPVIHDIREQLYEMGAIYAAMSGSGSSLFGLFDHTPKWEGAFKQHFVWFDQGE